MEELKSLYAARYRAIQQESIVTPLIFRKNARDAFKHYSDILRAQSASLTTKNTTALTFYTQWQQRLLSDVAIVNDASMNKKLLNEIRKSYLLSSEESFELAQKVSQDRIQNLKKDFISELYSPNEKKARKTAEAFIRQSDEANSDLIEKYITYELYVIVAIEADMTIYDQNALLIVRIPQGISEQSQIRKYIRRTNTRIHTIDRRTNELEAQDNNLIASIFALNIDLVTIRASYQKYEKALQKLSESARKSPAKRLSLYEKETSNIRTAHLDAVSGVQSLQDIQQVAKEIDTVLMRVFDLTTRQYNELMLNMKEYRELVRERSVLQRALKSA